MTDFDDLPDAQETPAPNEIPAPPRNDEEPSQTDYMDMPAPYGRFKSGKPRKTPPNGTRKLKTTTRKKTAPDYEEGLNGFVQMAAFGLAIAGDKNPVFLADSVAVAEHGPNLSAALNGIAQERPEVAAVLDKLLAVGPYGLLIGAAAPLIMQVLSNHGVKMPGVASAEDYVHAATHPVAA